MKNFLYRSLFLFWLAIGLPSLAFGVARSGDMDKEDKALQLEYYAKINPDEKCGANAGAGIDTQAGKEYKSACLASYKGSKEVAEKYLKDKAAAEAKIQALTSQSAASCGTSQKSCLEGVAANFQQASDIQKGMAGDLTKAHDKAQEWSKLNETALQKYRADLKNIETAETNAKNRAETLRSQGDMAAAARAMQEVQRAPTVSSSGISVAAQNGAANSISGYKEKISQLTREQAESKDHASQFSLSAQTEAKELMRKSTSYQKMAADTRAQAAALSTGGSSISEGKPVTTTLPPSRPTELGGSGGKANPGGGGAGVSSPGNTNDVASTSTSSQTNTSTSPSSNATSALTSAAPGMAAAASSAGAAGKSGGSGNSSQDPYAGMNGAAAYGAGQQQAEGNPKSTNFGEVLGTHDPRTKNQENQQAEAEPEAKAEEGSPEQVAVAGGLSGDTGESSGASSAPGIRGADGKPIRTGFSSASGGSLQSRHENMDKDAAAGGAFSADLKSGAVSIAGSEMKSAIQSLAAELGATDLDLDLGDLGAEEKAALAPLEGGDGVRNLAPVIGGRRTASVIQGSDASIQDEQSAALFTRTRSAHERAIKRGNLILGTRKKL